MAKSRTYIPIVIITALLFFGMGLQSAHAHALVANSSYSPSIRVNSCHMVIVAAQEQAGPCCKTAVCHRAIPQARDLGIPEYRTACHDSHLLISSLRLMTPQLRSGEPFILIPKTVVPHLATLQTNAITRQSLIILRTTVLLN